MTDPNAARQCRACEWFVRGQKNGQFDPNDHACREYGLCIVDPPQLGPSQMGVWPMTHHRNRACSEFIRRRNYRESTDGR